MTINRRDFLRLSGLTLLGATAASAIQWSGQNVVRAQGQSSDTLHVLNRLTWGARSQDVERINQMGIEGYIDWQLNPEAIDDPAVAELESAEPLYTMSYDELSLLASDGYEQIFNAAIWGRVFRAAYSERQFYELMVEFWTDHFNVPIGDFLAEKFVDDRDVIRKHALGKFRDLLFASAQSRAMLYYLDNASSDKEHPNENYARELMELHTLGVDGGYTEQDVKEVARALTGWTVKDGWQNGFYFDANMHDFDPKVILGKTFPAGRGIEEGLEVLDMLATHPATANFVCKKLCRRFVSDTPPQTLVDSAAQIFMTTDGDLRQVMRHILTSSEFMTSQGQKFRRPLDFVVAVLRVLSPSLTVDDVAVLIYELEALGQLPFSWHPPNGYPDAAPAWMGTSVLLYRWNLALLVPLASEGWVEGVSLNLDTLIEPVGTAGELVDVVTRRLLQGEIAPADRDQLVAFVTDGGDASQPIGYGTGAAKLPSLLGLVMASPYFQWH